ncbi:MAG TPA: hypothetical protein VKR52_17925 [Terracidiphilus sp.]|nr:hypothetical protein [Terracidiphilus sp.]
MPDSFQRLLLFSGPEALSLNDQAALAAECQPERSQFSHLVTHFLERFFNHETASPDGDAKARLILAGFTVGLPGFVMALFLWPIYHGFIRYPQDHPTFAVPPPYWLQVNYHFFYLVYSFVAMGIVTVFEWDLFFPDLLDMYVLQTLPIPAKTVFMARVTAIAIFIAGFLFDANVLAPFVLPAAIDPPNLARFLAGHILAVGLSGLFAAASVLALQGLLVAIFGERLFRRFSLLFQGLLITALLMLLFLFPALSGAVPALLQSQSLLVSCFPPFWYLGIYQRLMEGPSALPVYTNLAQTGCVALLITAGLTVLGYPVAYLRRVRQLIEGSGGRPARFQFGRPLDGLLHASLFRTPERRAVFHFIRQTILRVPRYRMYLIVFGSVGVSAVASIAFRLSITDGRFRMVMSLDGILAAMGFIAFWTIAGLRMALLAPGNHQGRWVFRVIQGRPPRLAFASGYSLASEIWVFMWALAITCGTWAALRFSVPTEPPTVRAAASQLLIAAGVCLLLTDLLFLHVLSIPFTGEQQGERSNLAVTVLKYVAFVPIVASVPVLCEPWIEGSVGHLAIASVAVLFAHTCLRLRRRSILRAYCDGPCLEEDEEEFPMKLGLRY